jgi:HEAT repeat protein
MNVIRSLLPVLVGLVLAGCATAPISPPSPVETAALAVLASDAGLREKARACQELGDFGGPASVPALAALLDREHLADYARSGLEGIKDGSAGEALRAALPKLAGRYLAGAVNSLGVRRDVAAVPALQKLALDSKSGAAEAAIASLGMIATPAATKTLQDILTNGPPALHVPTAHAALLAAEQLARNGNTTGARAVLNAVVRALPPGHLATVANDRVAALSGAPVSSARK